MCDKVEAIEALLVAYRRIGIMGDEKL